MNVRIIIVCGAIFSNFLYAQASSRVSLDVRALFSFAYLSKIGYSAIDEVKAKLESKPTLVSEKEKVRPNELHGGVLVGLPIEINDKLSISPCLIASWNFKSTTLESKNNDHYQKILKEVAPSDTPAEQERKIQQDDLHDIWYISNPVQIGLCVKTQWELNNNIGVHLMGGGTVNINRISREIKFQKASSKSPHKYLWKNFGILIGAGVQFTHNSGFVTGLDLLADLRLGKVKIDEFNMNLPSTLPGQAVTRNFESTQPKGLKLIASVGWNI